jgi:hypothetical protein
MGGCGGLMEDRMNEGSWLVMVGLGILFWKEVFWKEVFNE